MGVTVTATGRMTRPVNQDARAEVAEQVRRRVGRAMTIAHAAGAIDVFALLFFVLPLPAGVQPREHLAANLVGVAIYLPLALWLGHRIGTAMSVARSSWMLEGRAPDDSERARVLATPLHCARLSAGLWLGAALLFGAINLASGPLAAIHVTGTVVLGGITTTAIAYLLVETLARPVTALALGASGPPANPQWPGVEGRLVLAWVSATGVPLLGVLMVAVDGLTGASAPEQTMRATMVLGAVALLIGAAVTLVAARSVAEPLTAVRRALARVQAGDLGAEITVDDGSEVGLLQSGFNDMVAGLRERDRVQDLYSRQVGADVARSTLEDDPSLGGAVADVAALFVDLIGSTALAQHAPPERVVARLNRFFALVVEVVGAHGGWVNKFEGDAALCVFGAPAAHADPSGAALAAARELASRLRSELPGVHAGIGVSAGPAVAGWVGAEQRFEYTVIGDPVNEAARLCELAKRGPAQLLASAAVLERAGSAERGLWKLGEEVVLRGRSSATRIALPAAA